MLNQRLRDRIFKRVISYGSSTVFRKEEINGERCPTYLYRWRLLSLGFAKVYLHNFVGNDWTKDLHDHPKRFISIGLRGSYIEETPGGEREYIAPWVRTFPATHRHRLRAAHCWTLAIVGPVVRDWGFWHQGEWVEWEQYVKSDTATQRRDC
jgi:hypothetical protein